LGSLPTPGENPKFQAPNHKQISITKCQNAKRPATSFGHWDFDFGDCL
jgi:hypothetical protein